MILVRSRKRHRSLIVKLKCLIVAGNCTPVPTQPILEVSGIPIIQTILASKGLVAVDLEPEFRGKIDCQIGVVDDGFRVNGRDGMECDDAVVNVFGCSKICVAFVDREGGINTLESEDIDVGTGRSI